MNRARRAGMLLVAVGILMLVPGVLSAQAAEPGNQPGAVSAVPERLLARRTGDLAEMKKIHVIRVLVSYSKTNYFVAGDQPRGFEHELMRRYEKFLNKDVSRDEFKMHIAFIPVPFDELLPALIAGKGDIAAAGLTITPEREKKVSFSNPYLPDVDEVVVTARDVKGLQTLGDLSGRTAYVLSGSSYAEHLQVLNGKLAGSGKQPVRIVPASKTLETEDILELVNAGIIELTVADRHIAELWAEILPDIVVRDDLKVNTGGRIAWAVRKDNPELRASLNAFIRTSRKGTLLGNILFKRYYADTKWITSPLASEAREKLDRHIGLFKKYARQYGFDWRSIAAQAYQESRLDQSVRSRSGAIGIMQVKPSTAASVGITSIEKVENNIHAGVKYMSVLREKYFNGPELGPVTRFDFTVAAYNAGPTRVRKLREKAGQAGLDRNRWFLNVERVALSEIGQETVRYVGNINKYYIALTLLTDMLEEKRRELEGAVDRLPSSSPP